MPIVTITLNNKNFKLSCSESTKPRILNLASKLDAEMINVRQNNPYAPFELLLVMTILNLMDEYEQIVEANADQSLKNANKELQNLLNQLFAKLSNVAQKL